MRAAALLLAALSAGGCDPEPPVNLTRVAVLRYDRVHDCYAAMTPDGVDPAVSAHLAIQPCPTPATTTELRAGVDQVEVVVDYGNDVHFTHSATIPTPTIAVTLDGVSSGLVIALSNPQRGNDDRVFFTGTFVAPTTLSRNVAISATVSAAFNLTVATRFQIVPVQPAISLLAFRYQARPCYADLTAASDAPVDPIVDLVLCPAESAAPDPIMVAGVDQLVLVADYGPDISFDSVAAAPKPQYAVLVDGMAASTAIASTAYTPPSAAGRVLFKAPFTAPTTPSTHVVITARAVADGGFVTTLHTQFQIVPPTPRLRFLQFVTADHCYQDLTGDSGSVDPAIDIPRCAALISTDLRAGVDAFTVLVDYGPDLHFATPSAVPVPTLSLVLDGQPTATTIVPGTAFVTTTGRGYFLTTATAPDRIAHDVTVSMSISGSFALRIRTGASFVAPVPTLAVSGCPATGCTLTAGVGNAIAIASAPGPTPRSITFRTYIDNVLQNGTLTVMTAAEGDHTEVTQPFSVPAASQGQLWRIEADLNGVRAPGPTIQLVEPHPTAELSCGTSCTVVPGGSIGLTVVAPEEIHGAQALVLGRIDSLPLAPVSVTLVDVDRVAHTITGRQLLTAPMTAGQWTIDVSVIGYHASTLTVSVQ